MKKIGKFPIEIFGCDYENRSESTLLAFKQQYCKYIKDTCSKPRKSEPNIKVGTCTVGATLNKTKEIHPVIICPQRFKEDYMFETIRQKYLSHWENVKWISEVNIGVGGNIDYVAVEVDKKGLIKDFLCVEIQAAGTTRTPYPYVVELIKSGCYSGKKYVFGINWANEFNKTMMQQAYKKGKIVEFWKRKIVFIVQDVAMAYIQHATDCSKLEDRNPELPVDFCSFKLNWLGSHWGLTFDNIKSTSIEGINLILGGAPKDEYPTEQEFIKNIIKKGLADGIFTSNNNIKRFLNQ